jgi:hypothetical protein
LPPITLLLADPALRADLSHGLDDPPSSDTAKLAEFLSGAFGPSTTAVIHYGSHAHRSDARPESAHDFFVIVDRYLDAYRSLSATIGTSYSPITAAILSYILPPNVISVNTLVDAHTLRAKCAVLTLRELKRACSAHARDHFTQGRLFQHVQLVSSRDPVSRSAVIHALLLARARTFEWGRAYLPVRFDAETYCRVLLETSFSAEIRPEGRERIDALLEAQRGTMLRVYDKLLQQLTEERILASDGKVYSEVHPPGSLYRLRVAMYFRRSKLRATVRWIKYIALYDNWLEYILEKIARRSGVSLELTPRERRWPLLFLWPKAIHYIRQRPQRRLR